MKRVLAVLITLVLALSLASCGDKENSDKNNAGNHGNIPGGYPNGVDTPIVDIT